MRDCHIFEGGSVIAIDMKTLCGSYNKSRRRGAIHVISAFCATEGVVLGQLKTAKKSNEITAIPGLINLLDIKGKIITTDAMGCQKNIAEKIVSQDGDFLFAVKGNQGRLTQIKDPFSVPYGQPNIDISKIETETDLQWPMPEPEEI